MMSFFRRSHGGTAVDPVVEREDPCKFIAGVQWIPFDGHRGWFAGNLPADDIQIDDYLNNKRVRKVNKTGYMVSAIFGTGQSQTNAVHFADTYVSVLRHANNMIEEE